MAPRLRRMKVYHPRKLKRMRGLHPQQQTTSENLNLETTVRDGKVRQGFDSELLKSGGSHSQLVKGPPLLNDSGSKDFVNLPSPTAVSRLNKQALHDLEHKISSDVDSLIVLYEQGNTTQLHSAQLKAKSDFLKHSTDMQKIAQGLGERYVKAVRDYLDSVDVVIHSNSTWIDDVKVRHCYSMKEKLAKEIAAA